MKPIASNNTFIIRSSSDYITRARNWQSTSRAQKIRNEANLWASKVGVSISDHAWSCYSELRALREEGRALTTESEFQAYDKMWDSFCESDRFGLAVATQHYVLKVDPWERN